MKNNNCYYFICYINYKANQLPSGKRFSVFLRVSSYPSNTNKTWVKLKRWDYKSELSFNYRNVNNLFIYKRIIKKMKHVAQKWQCQQKKDIYWNTYNFKNSQYEHSLFYIETKTALWFYFCLRNEIWLTFDQNVMIIDLFIIYLFCC